MRISSSSNQNQRRVFRLGGVLASGLALVSLGAAPAYGAPTLGQAVRVGAETCLSLLAGADLNVIGDRNGLKRQDGGWVVPAGASTVIDFLPPRGANPNVCTMFVSHQADDQTVMFEALTQWAAAGQPPFTKVADREQAAAGNRLTTTWRGGHAGRDVTLILSKPVEAQQESLESTVMVVADPRR